MDWKEIIDITVPIEPGMEVWPGDPEVEVRTIAEEPTFVSGFFMSTHAGTHVDAPRHRDARWPAVDSLSLGVLCGPVEVVEPREVDADSGAVISVADLRSSVTRVILKTGYRRGDRGGKDEIPDYLGIDPRLAERLLGLGVRLIGTDAPSVEPRRPAMSASFTSHDLLLSKGVVLLENLELSAARPGSYYLCCLPLNIVGADGAPARAVLMKGELGG